MGNYPNWDDQLQEKVQKALSVFFDLDKSLKYCLNFSGGKDSHVLLGVYILAKQQGLELDCVVRFSDTGLEVASLYETIKATKLFCDQQGLIFESVKSPTSFWYWQFGRGYPVPTHFNRWCTGKLKLIPLMQDKRVTLTGRHLGESNVRDKRLSCGSNDCGVGQVKDSFDPILEFRNCDVWDFLFYADGRYLYDGVFDRLSAQYETSVDTKTGSLRMGCFLCPVVSQKTLFKNYEAGMITKKEYQVREILEELRKARRLTSPKTQKAGAIYIEDRKKIWAQLDFDYLQARGYLTEAERLEVDSLLAAGTYPKTYSQAWIAAQHALIS